MKTTKEEIANMEKGFATPFTSPDDAHRFSAKGLQTPSPYSNFKEEKMKTIEEEIAELVKEARRLDWETRNPRACPRAAYEAEERLRVTIEKIAELRLKVSKLKTQNSNFKEEEEMESPNSCLRVEI